MGLNGHLRIELRSAKDQKCLFGTIREANDYMSLDRIIAATRTDVLIARINSPRGSRSFVVIEYLPVWEIY